MTTTTFSSFGALAKRDKPKFVIEYDKIPRCMSNKIVEQTIEIIREILSAHDLDYDAWHIARCHNNRTCQPTHRFRAVMSVVDGSSNLRGIKIFTNPKPGTRDTCFESILVPPTSFDLDAVLDKLRSDRPIHEASPTQEATQETNPVHKLIGSVFDGKVTAIQEYGAFVEIMPGIDGLVHRTELSSNFVRNVNAVVKIGDKLRVKIIGVNGTKISLSASQVDEDAVSEKFTGVPDARGKLSLVGFMDDEDRMSWAFRLLCDKFLEHKNGAGFVPKHFVTSALKDEICRKYGAKETSVNGIINILSRDYGVEIIREDGDNIGYRLDADTVELAQQDVITKPVKEQAPAQSKPKRTDEVDFDLVEQYETKLVRLQVVEDELAPMQGLIDERAAINSWIKTHPDAAAEVKRLEALEIKLAERRARIS